MADDSVPFTVTADPERRLWTLRAEGAGVGELVVAGGTVYVSVPGERIAALDAGSGQVRWCSRTVEEASLAGMAVTRDVVVVPVRPERESSAFTALDAATGTVRWTRRESPLNRIVGAGDSTLVLWNDTPDDRLPIAGVDALTGETLWADEFGRSHKLLVRGELVILSAGGIRALDARSGTEVWAEGAGHLLRRGVQVEDADVFRVWENSLRNILAVRASVTGQTLAATQFSARAVKYFWGDPELVDGGRVLFYEYFGRRIRLFAYAGLGHARALGRWKLGRWRRSSIANAVCIGDRVYALGRRQLELYVAEIGRRRGLRRVALRGPDGRVLRWPECVVAGPGYALVLGEGAALVRDGRVLWVLDNGWSGHPLPLDEDRVLVRNWCSVGSEPELGLFCVDVETGRRVLP